MEKESIIPIAIEKESLFFIMVNLLMTNQMIKKWDWWFGPIMNFISAKLDKNFVNLGWAIYLFLINKNVQNTAKKALI